MEDKKVKDLLIRSFDTLLSDEENKKLKTALQSSETLQREEKTLKKLRDEFAGWNPDFNPGFYEKLMVRLANENPFVFRTIFRAFVLSGVAAILLVLLSVYFADGSLNFNSLLGINGYAPDLGIFGVF